MPDRILEWVRAAASKRHLFLPPAVRQMARPDRMVTTAEVEAVVHAGELVKDYPQDVRGHSCLVFGFGEEGCPLHVVCSPNEDYLAIITVYLPDPAEWSLDSRRRL